MSEVQALHNAIKVNDERPYNEPLISNGWSNLWLGCIIHQLGESWQNYRCRGEIVYYNIEEEGQLLIEMLTAWCNQEGFVAFIKEHFPSIEVYRRDEEPGYGNFTTDSFDYFPERFYIDCYADTEYFETIEQLTNYVKELIDAEVDPDINSIQDALDKFGETQDEDWFAYVWAFEEVK